MTVGCKTQRCNASPTGFFVFAGGIIEGTKERTIYASSATNLMIFTIAL